MNVLRRARQNCMDRSSPPRSSRLKYEKPENSCCETGTTSSDTLKQPSSSYMGKYRQNKNTSSMGTSIRYSRQSFSTVRPTWRQ